MTTVVIDIVHNTITTDGRVTVNEGIKKKISSVVGWMVPYYDPWIRKRTVLSDDYYNKFYRIRDKDGFMMYCCASGNIYEILEFIQALKDGRTPKKYLKSSLVYIIKQGGTVIERATGSRIKRVTGADSWIVMGSGSDYAVGALSVLSSDDPERASKAVEAAIEHDECTGGKPRTYKMTDFDDIH